MKSESEHRNPIKTDHLVVINGLDEDDAKVAYQAYRLGTLPWKSIKKMDPQEFVLSMDEFIQNNYDLSWSIKKDGQTLLILFGKDNGKFIILGDVIWWPKTTNRQRLQSVAAVLKEIRKIKVGLIEADYQYKRFYEILCNHKILRRVGSLYDTDRPGSRTTFFQTRAE